MESWPLASFFICSRRGTTGFLYVEDWAASHIETLRHYFPGATAKDFTDDRLESLLEILGNVEWRYWEEIEKQVGEHPISAYRLPTEVAELTPLPALFTIRTTSMVVGDTL